MNGYVNGLMAAVVVLMLITAFRLGRAYVRGAAILAIALIVFGVVVGLNINATLVS